MYVDCDFVILYMYVDCDFVLESILSHLSAQMLCLVKERNQSESHTPVLLLGCHLMSFCWPSAGSSYFEPFVYWSFYCSFDLTGEVDPWSCSQIMLHSFQWESCIMVIVISFQYLIIFFFFFFSLSLNPFLKMEATSWVCYETFLCMECKKYTISS